MANGWRTLVADSAADLRYREGMIRFEKEDVTQEIPLDQVGRMMVNTRGCSITTALMNELCRNNVEVVFCDEKQNPLFELAGFGEHHETAGKLIDQSRWTERSKQLVWKEIVTEKIRSQRKLLEKLHIPVPEQLLYLENSVEPGDLSNREGQAARLYFDALFGHGFRRQSPTDTNAALNYGYTILLSSFNRILALHGYHPALGIKHCSRSNRFNLSCDLMEPFRPVVDRIVYENGGRPLDWAFKKRFIEMLQAPVEFEGQSMSLSDAEEMYALKKLAKLEVRTPDRWETAS